jgi:hypothetical protein
LSDHGNILNYVCPNGAHDLGLTVRGTNESEKTALKLYRFGFNIFMATISENDFVLAHKAKERRRDLSLAAHAISNRHA